MSVRWAQGRPGFKHAYAEENQSPRLIGFRFGTGSHSPARRQPHDWMLVELRIRDVASDMEAFESSR